MELRRCRYNLAPEKEAEMWSEEHYFHRWFVKSTEKYGEEPMALIEDKNGKVSRAKYYTVQFLDLPK